MSATEHPLAEFYQALGHQTYSALGVLWTSIGRFSMMPVPCTISVAATQEDLDELLRASGRLAAVFPTRELTGVESCEFWVRNRDYGANVLQAQFRQRVKQGSKNCVVRQIDWETLRLRGMECNTDSMKQRGMSMSFTLTQQGWNRVCETAARVPGLEVFGCFHDERLVSFLIAWIPEDICHGVLMYRSRLGDTLRASHLLHYEFTRLVCARSDVRAVTLGRAWFPPRPSIDSFKRHAGYQVEPIRVAAMLNPTVRPLLGHSLTRTMLRSLGQFAGDRLGLLERTAVLDAAAVTQLPRRATAGR